MVRSQTAPTPAWPSAAASPTSHRLPVADAGPLDLHAVLVHMGRQAFLAEPIGQRRRLVEEVPPGPVRAGEGDHHAEGGEEMASVGAFPAGHGREAALGHDAGFLEPTQPAQRP